MEKTKKNNPRSLENSLVRSLVDPQDSAQRKRYIKRWIYGERAASHQNSNSFKRTVPQRDSIWIILHKMITGDD